MKKVILLSTSGCHLCEHAESMLLPLCHELGVDVEHVDIADDDALVEAYGLRIPVLKLKGSGNELGWPFDETEILQFIRAG